MKRFIFVAILCIFCGITKGSMFLDGGGSYTLDYDYSGDAVFVDYLRPNDYTHLKILSGAKAKRVNAYYNSSIDFKGGWADVLWAYQNSMITVTGGGTDSLHLEDNSFLDMSGGWHRLVANDSSTAIINGGYLYGSCFAGGSSMITMTGGYINEAIQACQDATVTIYGTGFNYGYGALPASGFLTGYIGGLNYSSFDFYVFGNASITLAPMPDPEIIPAPPAIILGSLGLTFSGWLLRKQGKF